MAASGTDVWPVSFACMKVWSVYKGGGVVCVCCGLEVGREVSVMVRSSGVACAAVIEDCRWVKPGLERARPATLRLRGVCPSLPVRVDWVVHHVMH